MAIITDTHWVATLISILFYELFRELSEAKSNSLYIDYISVSHYFFIKLY